MLSRFRRTDDGSVAVLAAVTFPVVLLCVALALATMVWSTSEHEAQRAADTAAVRAAATAFLGTDFPYADLAAVPESAYPAVAAIAAAAGLPVPDGLDPCDTVGVPPVPAGATLPGPAETLALPSGCAGVAAFVPPLALGLPDQSRGVACATARDAMAPDTAKYANRFYSGDGDSQPSCDDRIDVRLATGNPLVGFGEYAADTATGALDTQVVPQAPALATLLAAFGVRLETSLPSLLCPTVSVAVDQPVREPVFDRASVPNGRATARRVVKNAVVVPVFEGRVIEPATGAVNAAADGTGVTVGAPDGTTVTLPPVNLNAHLVAAQRQLLTLLDQVDALTDAAVRAADLTVDRLNGVYTGIDPLETQPLPAPGAEELDGLRLTKCLRDSIAQVFDPPAGDAPTADEVLKNAAASGEQVVVVQVGAVQAACGEPGAIAYDVTVPVPTATPECIRAATAPRLNPITGIYEVPFFDVTPVLLQDVGDGNYAAVPVHASQASGAFRAALVRATDDERYDPVLNRPRPTPLCDVNVPAPTPVNACDVLDVTAPPVPTPSPLPTESPLPSLTPLPSEPLPSESLLPSESPLATLSPVAPTVPPVEPTPTTEPCTLLCEGVS